MSPCLNCESVFEGRYCPTCGQSARDFNVPIRQFLKESAGEVFSLDGRFRQTLKPLILRPGLVARDYVTGRRARYVALLVVGGRKWG